MMIHEKIMSGQFLLDFKNDRTGILHAHHQHQLHHQQSSPPPMTASQLDLYSAYAYQQQQQELQQKLIGTHQHFQQQQYQPTTTNYGNAASAEVLDLSRRCDSVETPRKTPSPYHTNSSYGSPAGSPTSNQQQQQQQQQLATQLFSNNLLYSVQAQPQASLGLASLYPALYYPNVKQEAISPPPRPTPPQQSSGPATAVPATAVAATNLLQSLASVATTASPPVTAMQVDAATPHSPNCVRKSPNIVSTPTSSTVTMPSPPACPSATLSQDAKTTRPFKAFPRDPLVIAANFAATDVLLDNPRVERYTEYRKRVLEQIRNSNGGSRTITNPKMRRTNSRNGSIHEGFSSNHNSESDERNAAEESSDCDSNAGNFDKLSSGPNSSLIDANGNSSNVNQLKDAAYYERRRKNNAAAKKSRDRRRIKEDEIAIRAAYLERQNIELLCQIDALKAQIASYASKVGA